MIVIQYVTNFMKKMLGCLISDAIMKFLNFRIKHQIAQIWNCKFNNVILHVQN